MDTSASQAVVGWIVALGILGGGAYLVIRFYVTLYQGLRHRRRR